MPLKSRLINLINIPEVNDDCYLYFAQNPQIPFKIRRVYYITKPNNKLPRGFHAHKKTKQIIFCIQGSIKLILDNGEMREEIILDRPSAGVFLERMIWHEMIDFKKNTILLVLASKEFDDKDYIRDYEQFKKKTHKVS